jgi:hypothetical protein
VWLCCATLLCCRPYPGCVTVLRAVPPCPTVLCPVSTVLCSRCAVSVPPCRRRRLVKVTHGRIQTRSGASYQSLPTGRPNHIHQAFDMWNTLPNLTGSCARGAKPIGAFGLEAVPLPMLTNRPSWLGHRYRIVLPIITGRGVKYTHNDHINHTVPTHSGGPGLCVIHPERHQPLEVDHDPTRSTEYTGSRTLLAPATTTSEPASDCEYTCEAS